MNEKLLEKLVEFFGQKLQKRPCSNDKILAFNVDSKDYLFVAQKLKEIFDFESLADLTAIDNGENLSDNRFEVICHFYSHLTHQYLRICSCCKEDKIASLTSVYLSANWFEREAFDMFGIKFENHPNLKRILMWDEYPYYPLRKDFPVEGKPCPLPDNEVSIETGVKVESADLKGGPFYSNSNQSEDPKQREPQAFSSNE